MKARPYSRRFRVPGLVLGFLAAALLALPSGATEWFGEPIVTQTQPNLDVLRTIDLNHDGHLDLVAASVLGENPWSFRVFLGNGLGQWAASDTITMVAVGGPSPFALIDENRDGHTDIIGYNRTAGRLTVWRNDGEGRFSPSGNHVAGNEPYAIADIDKDGYEDFVSTTTEGLWIVYGSPSGLAWSQYRFYTLDAGPSDYPFMDIRYVGFPDLNGDGHLDLVATGQARTPEDHPGPAAIRWTLGNSTRVLGELSSFLTGAVDTDLWEFSAADLDGDGDLDLACGSTAVPDAVFYYDSGSNTFHSGGDPFLNGESTEGKILLAMIDDDELYDAAVCSVYQQPVWETRIFRGLGGGTFELIQTLSGAFTGVLAPIMSTVPRLDFVSAGGFVSSGKPLAVWPNLETVSDVEADGTSMARMSMHAHPTIATSSTRLSLGSMPSVIVDAEIFDIRGARVRDLTVGASGATWDLRDARGASVPSGVYWARAKELPAVRSARIVVAR